ncbi:MAG: phosphoribosylformimino-5-aminoimidazole carboxamide ribotide isomerase [Chitinispirillaceae bacterium]|jgi:phosphoribosylformimino-5-aminoimidazole carboxamide ribotide isomerase|nr:phosphoribosylformimino-5-aminoimidazole carboxamide ribotide isomerase [Chitinispirillaceae bacterium]
MRFRPCIDLHEGKVKQIVGSTLTDSGQPATNFESSQPSSYFAELYRRDELPGGHVIMLGPGNEAAVLEALAAFPGGLQAGGGITPDTAGRYLDAGASHVIVTSYVFSGGAVQWERLKLLTGCVGRQHLVLDLSCRVSGASYVIATDRWQKSSGVVLTKEILSALGSHCGEFLVHAVDVEGKQEGIDAALVRFLADASPVPVTYAGGIRSLGDLEIIRQEGAGRVDATVGSALDIFGGTLPYADVVRWHKAHVSSKTGLPA